MRCARSQWAVVTTLTHSLVTVHDGVQPVRDGDDRALGELISDRRLNEAIRL